jgi:hypothetical protein
MKIEPTGGAAQTMCATALVIGGSWNREGTIIFGDSETISQAPAKDGEAKRVTTLDASREETAHSTPFFLPDGRHFLYTTYSAQIRLTPCRSSIKAGTNEFHDGLFEYVRNDNLDTPSPFDGSQIPPFRRISSVPNSTDQ